MKASKKDIKIYKGVFLEKIQNALNESISIEDSEHRITKEETDLLLKYQCALHCDWKEFVESTKDMTHEQMQELKEYCKGYAMKYFELDLDAADETIKFNW